MKVAIFVRVSSQQQTTENQKLELYEVCERNDWTVVEEYRTSARTPKHEQRRNKHNEQTWRSCLRAGRCVAATWCRDVLPRCGAARNIVV